MDSWIALNLSMNSKLRTLKSASQNKENNQMQYVGLFGPDLLPTAKRHL